MTEPEKPARRPRYRGANPRRFDQKYKEHQPGRYADEVARVIDAGKTPAGTHRPIMVREVLEVLRPVAGEVAVDATLGHGGHAAELLRAVQPGGRLLAIDADPIELPRAVARLAALGYPAGSISTRRMNFAGLATFVAEHAPGGADVLIADLGLSSMQVDNPARGFTFKDDGPLDMRMNPSKGVPASTLLSTLGETRLARLLRENADEPHAEALAALILEAHAKAPLTTTLALARAIRDGFGPGARQPGGAADLAVRRAFQALRIAVNDEFDALDALLRHLPACLGPGGRAAILTFHSGEDRRVKSAFKEGLIAGDYATISPDFARATPEERRSNPRSTSAKLRWAVRAG